MRWERIEGGYRRGRVELLDNGGGGFGPAAGSGRWALMLDGRWLANIDTLAEAKRRGSALAAAAAIPAPVVVRTRLG